MQTYTNPVYDEYMADPFVLRHEGTYYAYGTTPHDIHGRVFRVLSSPNLVDWREEGGALIPIGAPSYWAPEVAYHDGQFYLYYSAGGVDGTGHALRVAISARPEGPFVDTGALLAPDQPFSIDAHPFRDSSGDWYMFYAADFLERSSDYHVGTGVVVDRMISMTQLEGNPRVVIRPSQDWHLFLPQRTMYGKVYDWYTIEGPAVLQHDGRYYCFFSGGAWERQNYGISYVVAEYPLGPYRPPAMNTPIFQTVPGSVIGPGHNSFTCSPDGEPFVVYHAWDAGMTARLMRIDRLRWQDGVPGFDGPTSTPQPAPSRRS